MTSSQKVRTLNRQPADGKRDRPIAFRRKTRQTPRLSDENRARPSGLPTKNATTPTAFQRKLHQAHSLPTTIRNRTSVTRAHEQHPNGSYEWRSDKNRFAQSECWRRVLWFSPKRRPCNERQRRPRRNNLVAARRFYSLWSVSGLSANFAPRTTGSSTRTKHQAKLHVRFFRRTYRPYIRFGILARFRRLPNATLGTGLMP